MHQQIKQSNSLTAPFATSLPSSSPFGVLEGEKVSRSTVSKKPLDFLLPFAIAANLNTGSMIRENLRVVTAELRQTRPPEKTDGDFHLLDFLITDARLPFATDPVKPWEYQGWLLPYVILANAARPDVINRWGWWAACHLESGLVSKPIPHVHFEPEFGPGAKDAFQIINRCLEIIGRGTGGSWSAYIDFIEWLAWGCGVAGNKPNFKEAKE